MLNQVGGNSMNMNGIHAPPSEDRYAALKDLDSLMKQTQLKEETTGALSASTWNANHSNGEYLGGGEEETHAERSADVCL